MHWARWDKEKAVGNAVAYVTGGGGPQETIKGVRVILSDVETKSGKLQYTHYRAEFPDGTVNERDLEFPGF